MDNRFKIPYKSHTHVHSTTSSMSTPNKPIPYQSSNSPKHFPKYEKHDEDDDDSPMNYNFDDIEEFLEETGEFLKETDDNDKNDENNENDEPKYSSPQCVDSEIKELGMLYIYLIIVNIVNNLTALVNIVIFSNT